MTGSSFLRFNAKMWVWLWLQGKEIDAFLVHNQLQLFIMFRNKPATTYVSHPETPP